MTWLESAARTPVADVAGRLHIEVRRHASSSSAPCPACGAERRHAGRHDRRGAVGIPHGRPHTWHCFSCDAAGDAVDFVAQRLHGRRFRELAADHQQNVRAWFEGLGVVTATRPRPQAVREPNYPPQGEVEALWGACVPVMDSPRASGYLEYRGIAARQVAEMELARALPSGADVPAWAGLGEREKWRSWGQSRHQLIVPLYDARGVMRNVLARSVDRDPYLKSAGAKGYERAGLVMADQLARAVLERGRAPAWWPSSAVFQVHVTEGEIDYMLAATAPGQRRATFGIVSGSWTTGIAKRLPMGAHVAIATDADQAGDRYAVGIAATLDGRAHCERHTDVPWVTENRPRERTREAA